MPPSIETPEHSMIELPQRWRVLLVQSLDEYFDDLDDTDDTDAITEVVTERIEDAATEVSGVEAEDLLSQFEAQLDGASSLAGALSDLIDADSDFDYTGEAIAAAIEQLCEIEYLEADADRDDAGFFGSGDEYDGDDDDEGGAFDLSF
jgi:hypothetical protein